MNSETFVPSTAGPGQGEALQPVLQKFPIELLQMLRGSNLGIRAATPQDRLIAACKSYNNEHGHVVPVRSTESIVRAGWAADGQKSRKRRK